MCLHTKDIILSITPLSKQSPMVMSSHLFTGQSLNQIEGIIFFPQSERTCIIFLPKCSHLTSKRPKAFFFMNTQINTVLNLSLQKFICFLNFSSFFLCTVSAFYLFYLFIYLLMAVLGLRFCARAFSSCGKRGPLFIAVRRPLTIAASLVVGHRLQTRRLSNCGSRAPVAPRHVASSQTRARTRVPCIGRQILNHCATREAPNFSS